MRVITVSRVPTAGSVAQTVLKYGTGGLNIDACRIVTSSADATAMERVNSPGSGRNWGRTARQTPEGRWDGPIGTGKMDTTKGRWPANLILQHLPECQEGNCAEGCPVRDLDNLGETTCGSNNVKNATVKGYSPTVYGVESRIPGKEEISYGDSGSVARYFKQVKVPMKDLKQIRQQQQIEGFKKAYGEDELPKPIPQELIDYLLTLISSPDGAALYLGNLANADWANLSTWADNSIFGIIAEGCPTEEQVTELQRVLRPGAHLLLIAPDTQPTGHTGACRLEDGGFEIRDSILLIDEPGRFHYVAKTSRSEREAGCGILSGKPRKAWVCKACESDKFDPDTLPECSESESGEHEWEEVSVESTVKNHHPTVKPIKLMKRLLKSVPVEGGVVIDPFMGSGSTLLAALDTGHDIIGIDQEEDYVKTADARVRHYDREVLRKHETVIESDRSSVPEVQEMSMLEMLGLE